MPATIIDGKALAAKCKARIKGEVEALSKLSLIHISVFHITVRRTGQKETRLDGRAVQTGIELGCCEGEHQVEASF